ncbi:helix-turn-helix domain-containing protein [Geodermatophilus sp. URMC 65]
MTGTAPTIGQLAARLGVPVRTVRFWSDEGLVDPPARSVGGYRLYDAAAVARLDLVRTLRELGLGLPAIRELLARRRTVAEVAAEHLRAWTPRSGCCGCTAPCCGSWPRQGRRRRRWGSCTSWPRCPPASGSS